MVATHQYTFSTSGEYQVTSSIHNIYFLLHCIHGDVTLSTVQEYTMKCHLCGYGSASVSVLPDDPREKPLF